MGARFEIDYAHVKERLVGPRYQRHEAEVDGIVSRVMNTLHGNSPDDWRFTESPSSRFFVLDEQTEAKFLGMSYRDSTAGRGIVQHIQRHVDNTSEIFTHLDSHVQAYIDDVQNADLPIVHQIRTVYGKGKGAYIAEERRLFEKARSAVAHLVPLMAHKIASRPNAIVTRDGCLWVRQYLNWMSMRRGGKEYYIFQPLTAGGIDKGRYAVFSYSENGSLKKTAEKQFDCPVHFGDLGDLKAEILGADGGVRSESYWKVPTYVDRCLMDLDFVERYSEKGAGFTSSMLVELYFLRIIVNRAREKLYRT